MRLFLIVIGIAAVAFLGLMALGGGGQEAPKSDADKENYDAQSHWWLRAMGAIGEPFAPKLELPERDFALVVPPAPPKQIEVARSDEDIRLAKFELVRGRAASIVYQCSNGEGCSQTLCLVAAGVPAPDNCGKNAEPKESGSLRIDPSGGTLTFLAVLGEGEVRLR